MKLLHKGNLPPEASVIWAGGVVTSYLGRAAGSEKIYVNIDRLPANTYSAKYHSHSLQEEFFLVLSGIGTLRMDGETCTVKAGDFVAKPCATSAHQFYNPGPEPLEILDVGTVEKGDVAYYPDEQIYLLRGRREAYGPAGRLPGWSSDPNE